MYYQSSRNSYEKILNPDNTLVNGVWKVKRQRRIRKKKQKQNRHNLRANESVITTGFHTLRNPPKPKWQNKMAQNINTVHFKNMEDAHSYWLATSDRNSDDIPARHTHVDKDNQCQEKLQGHGFPETNKNTNKQTKKNPSCD